jgi:hypothetical protein
VRASIITPAVALLAMASAACALDRTGLEPFDGAGLSLHEAGAGGAGGTGSADGADAQAVDAIADASGGDGGTTDAGAEAGSDAPVVSPVGCADGTREGYLNVAGYPLIAACGGGWSVPGLLAASALAPQCRRQGGNSGSNPTGAGCSVTDLCAEGWHVCRTAQEVFQLAGDCKDALGPAGAGHTFFVTLQRALGNICPAANDVGTNHLHGCGNFGTPEDKSCAPFMFMLKDADCSANAPWLCPTTSSGPMTTAEYETVTKLGSAHGGALCCHD